MFIKCWTIWHHITSHAHRHLHNLHRPIRHLHHHIFWRVFFVMSDHRLAVMRGAVIRAGRNMSTPAAEPGDLKRCVGCIAHLATFDVCMYAGRCAKEGEFSTPEMRARIRELAHPPRDDFDRAVLALAGDYERLITEPVAESGDAEMARKIVTKFCKRPGCSFAVDIQDALAAARSGAEQERDEYAMALVESEKARARDYDERCRSLTGAEQPWRELAAQYAKSLAANRKKLTEKIEALEAKLAFERACVAESRAALRRLLATINPGNVDTHVPGCRCVIHEAREILTSTKEEKR